MSVLPVFLFALLRECPPMETITHCRCHIAFNDLEIYCGQLQTESQLEHILKNLKGSHVSKLEIRGMNASTWKKDNFDSMYIEILFLEKIEVDDASFLTDGRQFQGLENSLVILHIRNSFRNDPKSLFKLKLDHLSKLQHIILDENHIPEVGNDWFTSGPAGLQTLDFRNNGIEKLGDRAFASLTGLFSVSLEGNRLTEISRSVFPRPASHLHTLDLANNKLRHLPNNLFDHMPLLNHVNLQHNLIQVLQEDLFSEDALSNLILSLEGNPLECDGKLQWLCESEANINTGTCAPTATNSKQTIREFCGREH